MVSLTLLTRIPIPLDQGPTLMTSFMTSPLITFLKALAPNIVTWKIRASTYDFLEGRNSAHNTMLGSRDAATTKTVLTPTCRESAAFTTTSKI